MLRKTQGIILHAFPYGETSLIAKIYCSNSGIQSFLIHGVRKPRARIRQNMFQPLVQADMVVWQKEKSGLHHIREISLPQSYQQIPYNIVKTSIAIFMAEMLLHVLKEQEANPALYGFISDACWQLDQCTHKASNFHLVFLLKLTGFLGFRPEVNYSDSLCSFNLKEGVYQDYLPGSAHCLSPEISRAFFQLSTTDLEKHHQMNLSTNLRRELLDKIIAYYRIHIDGLGEIKSHHVLETVLS